MTVQVAPGQSTTTTASLSANATPEQIAQDILYQNDPWIGSYDLPAIRQSLDALAQIDPQLARQVETAVMAQLTPREQGELRRATYAINAGEAGAITIADNAPSVQSYFEGTATGNAAADRAFYARLDRTFGDGDPATNDVARIESGIGLLIRGDISLEQYETLRAAGVQDGVNVGEVVLDLSQMTLDIVGIFDQTGLSDGANALISAGRGDWVGAGLSVLAIVPVVGALAAAGKLGKWAETVTKAVELAANSPAAKAALEPMLRRLNDAIGAIPDAVMRNLPESMRSTLEGLKTKLDDFFGVAQRGFADLPELRGATDVTARTADEVNASFIERGWQPPYAAGREAIEFTTGQAMTFVRVHGADNMARSWMMRADDIEGLSASQIKDLFALPDTPSLISQVNVPAGTRVRVGEVAPQDNWGQGGATQFELLERLPESAFTNTRPLE